MKLKRKYARVSYLPRSTGPRVLIFAISLLLSMNALAINTSLQPEEVEQAYSLGRASNHEDLTQFLSQYEHDFKYPGNNPIAFVQSVEFQTPYEQIVLRTMRSPLYDKFKAAEDYQANRGVILVRVMVSLKTGYSGPPPADDSFKVSVLQGKMIEPRKETGTVICDPYDPRNIPAASDCLAYTREILLRFDASQFGPGRATVRVSLLSGEPLETKFNLDRLK